MFIDRWCAAFAALILIPVQALSWAGGATGSPSNATVVSPYGASSARGDDYAGPAPSEELRAQTVLGQQGAAAYFTNATSAHLNAIPSSGARCAGEYAALFAKPIIDVRIAFGYQDWVDIKANGKSDGSIEATNYKLYASDGHAVSFGYNGSSDLFWASGSRAVLLQPCANSTGMQACGFTERTSSIFEKQIPALDGTSRQVTVRVRLTHASASPFYAYNIKGGALESQQIRQTADSEDNFFGGLREADVVLSNGHARNGGGMDFTPVVIGAGRHPDYVGYYKVARPGLNAMERALQTRLQSRGDSPYFIGLFSCLGRTWFEASLKRNAPTSRIALTSSITDDGNAVSLGPVESLDAIMRRQCHEQFQESIALRPRDRSEIHLIEPSR